MDKPIEFRSRGRGYDKNDVNEFISKENIRFNKIEEEYKRTIRDLEREIEKLSAQIKEAEGDKAQIVSLEASISEFEKKIDNLDTSLTEKDAIIDGLKSAVDNANQKLEMANSMIEDLKKPTSVPRPAAIADPGNCEDSVIEKAKKYDSLCNSIDEIFAFAKEEADKIISEAIEIRKQAIKKSASSNYMKNELNSRSRSIIDELRSNIRRQMKK